MSTNSENGNHKSLGLLMIGVRDTTVRVSNVLTKEIAYDLDPCNTPVNSVAFSSDGKWLLVTAPPGLEYRNGEQTKVDGTVMLVDAESGQISWEKRSEDYVLAGQFILDGSTCVSIHSDGSIRAWEIATGDAVEVSDLVLENLSPLISFAIPTGVRINPPSPWPYG